MTCRIRLADITIEADTAVTISHTWANEATAHPVEDGGTISDHVQRKPTRATLDVVFSAHPLRDGLEPSGPKRPRRAFTALTDAMTRRDVVGVYVDGEVYDPAVLLQVTEPRTFDDGDSRRFQIEVQAIQIVEANTAPSKAAARLRTKGAAKRRTQQATVADLKLAALGRAAQGDFVGAIVLGVASVAK